MHHAYRVHRVHCIHHVEKSPTGRQGTHEHGRDISRSFEMFLLLHDDPHLSGEQSVFDLSRVGPVHSSMDIFCLYHVKIVDGIKL